MLPVWLLLAPRDYLSTFLKIGVVVALAIGIYLVQPDLKMQAVTRFADGSGPVFSGPLFPFLFITIACGAVSGFHSLISSGTTPKMIERESHARFVGYGGMLMELFVAIMALSAACVLDPGIYFAMNSPAAVIGDTPQRAAEVISSWGWVITPETITQTASDVGERTILNRAGGAPTLAVGMAQIMAQAFGGKALEAFWYHFAILFEALFILTAVDAGTRAGRFMIQDLLGHIYAPLGRTELVFSNIVATLLCVAGWGWFVYQGTVDPLGGVNTIWPLVRHLQPDARRNRIAAGDDHPDQAQAGALCLGHARADRLAPGLHADGRLDEGLLVRPAHRVLCAGEQVQRCGSVRHHPGSREEHRRDAARGIQQLRLRDAYRDVRRPGGHHGLLHRQDVAAGAPHRIADRRRDTTDGSRGRDGRCYCVMFSNRPCRAPVRRP